MGMVWDLGTTIGWEMRSGPNLEWDLCHTFFCEEQKSLFLSFSLREQR